VLEADSHRVSGLEEFRMISSIMAVRRFFVALSLVAFPLGALAAGNALSFTAHSLNLKPSGTVLLALDGQGDAYHATRVGDESGRVWIRVTKTNPQGKVVATYQFGGTGSDAPEAMKVDEQGEVVIVGTTTSTDFPVTTVLVPAIRKNAAFVVKLDSGLIGIIASTLLGGSQYAASYLAGTGAGALDVDSAGNVYVGGYTGALDFPVTAGAYQTAPPGYDSSGAATLGFVAELSPALSKILFATYYGSSTVECFGISCTGAWGATAVRGLAVDASGAIVAAADTVFSVWPSTTRGILAARFAPGGGSAAWEKRIGRDGTSSSSQFAEALALDSSGDVVIVGTATNGVYPTTGAAQSCGSAAPTGGFVAKLSGSSGAMQFLTAFGCQETLSPIPEVVSVAIDASGTIWITGVADPAALPAAANSAGSGTSYVAALAADGASVEGLYMAGGDVFGEAVALTAAGNPVVTGRAGFLMLANSAGGPSLFGVTNAAGSTVSPFIAPAELVSFYGTGLGPAAPLNAQVVDGVVESNLSGYQLLIGGVAAPLLYVAAGQINAIVPKEVSGQDSVSVTLVTPTGTFPLADLFIRPSQPEVFHYATTSYAEAINQDGTLNSFANPAHAGQLVSIWATGAGAFGGDPALTDGAIVPIPEAAASSPLLPVFVLFAGVPTCSLSGGCILGANESLEVDYAGVSPGAVFGLLQVNFRLPQSVGSTHGWTQVRLQVGAASSEWATLQVAP
jgi:uncharacterized protein (TIGR03437 family)